jgi:hypothetical protein
MAAPAFPTGILRWMGDWSGTTTYHYGDVVLASDNTSYACGIVSSLNQNPAPPPSIAWAAFPNQGGGGGGVQSVTAGIGLRNSGTASAVNLNVPISTVAINETNKIVTGGATSVLWTTQSFTPLQEGNVVINFSVTCENNDIASDHLDLELFYKPALASDTPMGITRLTLFPPAIPVYPLTGYNATFSVSEYFTVQAYTFFLKGTCPVSVTVNPWIVTTSIGYFQIGLPLYAL